MKKGKMVTYLVVGLLVLYILYLMFRATKLKTKEGCFVFEETHEDDGGAGDWICLHPDSRPESGTSPFNINGGKLEISDTTASLDGVYTILNDEWRDTSDRQACFLINHDNTYNYTTTQGGNPKDVDFYGKGQVCPA